MEKKSQETSGQCKGTWKKDVVHMWRPCSDFMDRLRRLLSCRIIIIIIISALCRLWELCFFVLE